MDLICLTLHRFFDAWRAGAYQDAIDALHRYFDYSMEGYGSLHNIKTYHQYALLHLAVLHADFGCFEEAISAMNECIATGTHSQSIYRTTLTGHSKRESRRKVSQLWPLLARTSAEAAPAVRET